MEKSETKEKNLHVYRLTEAEKEAGWTQEKKAEEFEARIASYTFSPEWEEWWADIRIWALQEWDPVCKDGADDAFVLAERLRLASREEQLYIAEMVNWSRARTLVPLGTIQFMICNGLYPKGRPQPSASKILE